jgi:hypothetical protein
MATVTVVFPCFFLSWKANARVKPAKRGHGPHSSKFLCYYMCCLFCVVLFIVLCICVLYCCHRVATQLQLTNISYHIIIYKNHRYDKETNWLLLTTSFLFSLAPKTRALQSFETSANIYANKTALIPRKLKYTAITTTKISNIPRCFSLYSFAHSGS